MVGYRLKVKCTNCKAAYTVIIYDVPQLRVHRNTCLFCGSLVHPDKELPSKTIDSFINPEKNNQASTGVC
jgi:hypothetical protein